MLDDGTAETYLVLSALRSRGWHASAAPANRPGLLDLLVEPPRVLFVSAEQADGRSAVGSIIRRVHADPGIPDMITLANVVGDPPRSVRSLRLLSGLRRDRPDGGPPRR